MIKYDANLIKSLMGKIPVAISIGGRKAKISLNLIDSFFSLSGREVIGTKYGEILFDLDEGPQRFMAAFFDNVDSYYINSPLGKYISNIPPCSFIDIGANLGIYSIIAKSSGMNSYAVEPEPSHADFLRNNSEVIGAVVQIALAEKPGQLPIYYSPDNPGATSLVPAEGFVPSKLNVDIETFSSLANKGIFGDLSEIGLIKIDVEGFEENVIAGMRDFLSEGYRPDIWCEVRGRRSGRAPDSFVAVTNELRNFGYDGFDGEKSNPLSYPYRSELETTFSSRQVFDMLFKHEAR